jgi:hypothetical protein
MANTYLKRTNGSPTSDKIGTISVWFKRSKLGSDQRIHMNFADGSNYGYMKLHGDNYFHVVGVSSGSESTHVKTNRLFRDTNAWYHLVVAIDTTQATASDRTKFYINGVQETSLAQSDYPSQNLAHPLLIASGSNYHTVGAAENGTVSFDGSMSHFHKCDGTALAPTVFGSTDSTTAEWKINTSPSFTVGNTGYTILKDGNTITDQSSNSNDFTVGAGTLTNTEDCPSNVFATLNPLDRAINGTAPTFANGNNRWTASGNGTSNNAVKGTLGASSGKYYWEAKFNTASATNAGMSLINGSAGWNSDGDVYDNTGFYGIQSNGNKRVAGVVTTGVFTALSNDDIGMLAYDLDNNKFWFGVNGTWVASGDPANGTNSLGTLASGTYLPILSNGSWNTASSTSFNFGNGYFGTTAVASAGTNASGNGIFEYDVPTGYTALSTKGLNL